MAAKTVDAKHAKKEPLMAFKEAYSIVPDSEDYTHVVMTRSDYNGLLTTLRNRNSKINELNVDYKDLVGKYNELVESYNEVTSECEDYQQKIEGYKSDLGKIQEIRQRTIENQKTIDDVLSIVKERANKERHLKNKKDNNGYIILSSEDYTYHEFKKNWGVHKTTFQTPFPTELNKPDVVKLWNADEERAQYFRAIGIGDKYQFPQYNQAADFENKWKNDDPVWFELIYRRNFTKGFWEVGVVHIKEICL